MRKILFFFALYLGFFPLIGQNIVYVNPEARGINNGSSWENAYTSLKKAIENANPNAELWLSMPFEGFRVSENNKPEDHIVVDKPLSIRGGFQGREKTLEERDTYSKNFTILDGNIGKKSDVSDNSRNAFIIRANVFMDRVHFRNFNSNYRDLDYYGAVSVDTNAIATIHECTFTNNLGLSQGTCISATKDALVTIRRTRFESNSHNSYGSLISRGENAIINLTDSDFLNNGSQNGGDYVFGSHRHWDNKTGIEENKRTLLSVQSCNFAGNSMGIASSNFGGSRFVNCQFVTNQQGASYQFNFFGDSTSVYFDSCHFTGTYSAYLYYASGLKEFVFNNSVIENPASSLSSFLFIKARHVMINGSEFNNIRGSTGIDINAEKGTLTIKNSRFIGGKASNYYLNIMTGSMYILDTEFTGVETSNGNYFVLDSLYIKNSIFSKIIARNEWLGLSNIQNALIDSSVFSDIVQFETLFRINKKFLLKNSIIENIRMSRSSYGKALLFHNWDNSTIVENTQFSNFSSDGPMVTNVGTLRWLGNEINGIPQSFVDNSGHILIYNSNFHDLRGPWIISKDGYPKSRGKSVTLLNNIVFSDNDTMVYSMVTEGSYQEYIANCITNRPLPSGSDNVVETVLSYYDLYEPYGVHLLQDKGMPLADTLYLPEKDIAGNPRIIADKIDIGAYEVEGLVTATLTPDNHPDDLCFPNPFNDALTLRLTEKSEIEIFTLRGELLYADQYTAGSPVISTGWLDPGIYLLGIRTAKKVEQIRIVKN